MDHWPVSLGGGAASALANLLFIASFRTMPAATGATIYRLNLVVAAILSFVWLGEPISGPKLAGVAMGAAAVLLLWQAHRRPDEPQLRQASSTAALMLLAACLLRAVMGVLYKQSTTLGIAPLEMLTVSGLCWLLGGIAFALLRRESLPTPRRTAPYCLAGGLLICGVVYFLLQATRHADASVVLPISQLSFVVTSLLAVSFDGERLSGAKTAALAAAACVVAMSWA